MIPLKFAKVFVAAALMTTFSAGTAARAAAAPQHADDNVMLQWSGVLLQAVRDTRLGPPMVARALAIVHTCMYDAWSAYDAVAVGTRLGGSLRRPESERTEGNKRKAISYAAYRALVDLFPSRKADFDAKMSSLGYDPADATSDQATAAGVGNVAAAAVLAFRHHDGSNQLGDMNPGAGAYADYTGYQPANTPGQINDPNRWQPLSFFNPATGQYDIVRSYIGPHWGNVTPFAMSAGALFRPAVGPARFPHGSYTAQANHILHITANLTDRQKVIAEYWADGPKSELPPGHWCLFAEFVSRRDHHTLDQDVKMFFALANALLDAGIATWDAKLAYDSPRPVTAIRFLKAGKPIRSWGGPGLGTVKMRGEDWIPYQPNTFITPPFPEYTSGHSAFSAVAAEILKSFTGSDAFGHSVTIKAGATLTEPGLTPAKDTRLSWATFTEAAEEAGMSRLYGGIHFMDGNVQGQVIGRQVGALVWSKAQSYFDGTARY